MLLALRQYKVCLISSLPLVTRFLSTGSDEEGASMSMFDLNDVMGMNTLDELLKLGDSETSSNKAVSSKALPKRRGRKPKIPKKNLDILARELSAEAEKISAVNSVLNVPSLDLPEPAPSHSINIKIQEKLNNTDLNCPANMLDKKSKTIKKKRTSKFMPGALTFKNGEMKVFPIKKFCPHEKLKQLIGEDGENKQNYSVSIMMQSSEYKVINSGCVEPVLTNFSFDKTSNKKDESTLFFQATNMIKNKNMTALCESGPVDPIMSGELFVPVSNVGIEPFVTYPGMALCKTEFYYL